MAGWRCVICFAFIALTLTALLSHINRAHGRSSNFSVICGIDDCREQYRVFNSFYYHIKRRHASYLANGRPPLQGMPFRSGCVGGEWFDIPIFSNCITLTSNQIEESTPSTVTSEDANCNEPAFLQEDAFHGESARMPNPDQVHNDNQSHIKEKVSSYIECYKVQHVGFCVAVQLVWKMHCFIAYI